MRIILTKEENEARLRKPKGAVTVRIHGSDEIARVAVYADVSGSGALEKLESEIPVEIEETATWQPREYVIAPKRQIKLRD